MVNLCVNITAVYDAQGKGVKKTTGLLHLGETLSAGELFRVRVPVRAPATYGTDGGTRMLTRS